MRAIVFVSVVVILAAVATLRIVPSGPGPSSASSAHPGRHPGQDAAVVTLVAGDQARRDRIEQARVALADALARRGKPATVELSVRTDLAAAAVDVTLTTRVPAKK